MVVEAAELPAIYAQIEDDLRSRYLLAYQSTATSGKEVFRPVAVHVARKQLRVRTSSGYYP